MKRLIPIFLFLSGPAWSAITKIQQNSSTPASALTETVTLPTITAGNLVVVSFLTNSNVTLNSVDDTAGNTYTIAVTGTFVTGVGRTWIAYKEGVVGIGTTNTVTGHFSSSSGGGEAAVVEYSGAATASALDQAPAQATGTSATMTSTSFNPGQTGEVAVAWCTAGGTGGNPTAGTNYLNIVQPDAFTSLIHRTSAPTGSQTATCTLTSNIWIIEVATFKPAAAVSSSGFNKVSKLLRLEEL